VVITGVQKDSPAEKAGLEAGDVVVEWAGKKVADPTELRLQVAGTPIGSTVTIIVIRDTKPLELKVTVGERDG
jgi:serine protease Do